MFLYIININFLIYKKFEYELIKNDNNVDPKTGPYSPHNLYFNVIHEHITDGWVIYLDDDVKDEYIQCYSYDYSFDYPKCMASDKLYIPSKQGKEYKLEKLPENINDLKTGYYRIKITCENPEFRKLFTYSKKNTYTERSIMQAMKYKDDFDDLRWLIR